MTLKEAKDILKKEGFKLEERPGKPYAISEEFTEFEDPNICEAMQVVSSAGYAIMMAEAAFNARKARLKEELEEHANAPVSGKEKAKEENPALKESASQFKDALLDEQAKEIVELTEENERLKDQVAVIYACKENNEKYNLKQIKRLGKEIAKLNSIIHDKNAVLSDVAEELRLSKIREKNLTEVCQKYMKENEELKNELDAFKKSYKRRLKEDSEHFEHIQKICNVGLQKWLLESEYLEKDKPFRFPQLPDFNEEEEKKHSLFRDDSVGAVTNQKDCSPVKDTHPTVDIAEEGGDHSAIIAQCCKNIAISKDEAEIIERCTKNGTELHYSEKDGFTYTNMFGDEMPIICLRGIFHVFTEEELKNMKK